jgi:nuclear transport factor 2 (NTF2) superfamily protein
MAGILVMRQKWPLPIRCAREKPPRKWTKALDYRLIKELWAFTNRIAVRFAYEWHDDSENWYRSYGNENWEFNDDGLMRLRFASINDLPITRIGSQVSLAAWTPSG